MGCVDERLRDGSRNIGSKKRRIFIAFKTVFFLRPTETDLVRPESSFATPAIAYPNDPRAKEIKQACYIRQFSIARQHWSIQLVMGCI